jgi:hypothetical protein
MSRSPLVIYEPNVERAIELLQSSTLQFPVAILTEKLFAAYVVATRCDLLVVDAKDIFTTYWLGYIFSPHSPYVEAFDVALQANSGM